MKVGDSFQILTGSVDLRFHENERIMLDNFAAGRPLNEGFLPPRHVPDPNGLPEVLTVVIVP